jgi:hypothetical protein
LGFLLFTGLARSLSCIRLFEARILSRDIEGRACFEGATPSACTAKSAGKLAGDVGVAAAAADEELEEAALAVLTCLVGVIGGVQPAAAAAAADEELEEAGVSSLNCFVCEEEGVCKEEAAFAALSCFVGVVGGVKMLAAAAAAADELEEAGVSSLNRFVCEGGVCKPEEVAAEELGVEAAEALNEKAAVSGFNGSNSTAAPWVGVT